MDFKIKNFNDNNKKNAKSNRQHKSNRRYMLNV